MELEFQTIEELYQRIYPALRTKVRSLKRKGITHVQEEDIWNYLKSRKWIYSKDLMLADMVNDILNTSDQELSVIANEPIVSKEQHLYDTEII